MIEGSAEELLERTLSQVQWGLEESERRYREIFENAKDAVYVHDLNGRYTLVNPAAEELTGYSRDELLQLSVFDMASPEHIDLICKSLKQKLTDHAPTTYEVEAIKKDGTRVPVEVSSRLIYRDGRPIGVQGSVRDVSERRRAEEVVRASEQRFRDLVENANDIIFTCDMHGNITSLNRAGERVTGYTADEALKMNIAQAVSPDDIAKVRHMLSRKRVADVATVYDLELITKSQGRAAVEISSRVIMKDGEAVGVQGIARDITDRKRMEDDLRVSQAQLQQSQRLEAVGQLAGGVAHDFNNLLTAIIGYSDFALRKMRANNPIRRDIEEIKKAANRAATLTRQLLAFSRKQILKPEVLDLDLVVGDMHKMLERLIGEDIDLVTTLGRDIDPVKADRGQLEQIIMNLVVNARDAMPFGGSVTIETADVVFDEAYTSEHVPVKPGKYAMLAVSDTGLGMDANTQLHIFEPFFTTKELGKGTGLGLSTVYGIVKQSGGFIWVYSELNVGTTFKIYLPSLTELHFDQELISIDTAESSETGTVLLVEDDPLVRNVALRALESAGYKVLESGNGHGALAMAHSCEDEIDLLITDVVMPLMGGRELAQELSALHPKTSILFMSGYTDDAVVRHGIMDKDIEYLQKPFTPESLVRRVGEVLRDARTRTCSSG
jgi:PAS domain S-box-containing protein